MRLCLTICGESVSCDGLSGFTFEWFCGLGFTSSPEFTSVWRVFSCAVLARVFGVTVNVHKTRGMDSEHSGQCLVFKAFWHTMLCSSKLANFWFVSWINFGVFWMARTISVNRKKWRRARHIDWNTRRGRDGGCHWCGTLFTRNLCPHHCVDQFKFGEPETVFTTEGSQEERERESFGLRELSGGSVIRHWCVCSGFSECHFAFPHGLKILDSASNCKLFWRFWVSDCLSVLSPKTQVA